MARFLKLLKLEFQPRLGLSVSPDERYVLLAKPDEKGTDLVLVEDFRWQHFIMFGRAIS